VRQLQQIGLGQAAAFEQRPPAAAFTLQVAKALTAELSIPAAAKAAGLKRFVPVELPGAPADSSSGSSLKDKSASSSKGDTSSGRGRDSSDSRDSRDSRGRREGRDDDVKPWERRGPAEGSRRDSSREGLDGSRTKPWERDGAETPWERRGPMDSKRGGGRGGATAGDRAASAETSSGTGARRSLFAANAGSSAAAAATARSNDSGSISGSLSDVFAEAFSGLQEELGVSSIAATGSSKIRRLRQRTPEPAAAAAATSSSDSEYEDDSWQERPSPFDRRGAGSGSSSSRGGRGAAGVQGRRRATWDEAESAEGDLSGWADDYGDVVGQKQEDSFVRQSIRRDLDDIVNDRSSRRGR
jgi:hypothetical protein